MAEKDKSFNLNEQYLEDSKDMKEKSFEGWFYSERRMDLILVSISGAGIYLSISVLKHAQELCCFNSLYIKLAGVFFAFAIIINFLSQWTSSTAHYDDYLFWKYLLLYPTEADRDEEVNDLLNKHFGRANLFNNLTLVLNIISTILMIAGILLCIINLWSF
ncbi:MAG: hypothetical protein JXR19_11045 [Bacteroidia bacterium]